VAVLCKARFEKALGQDERSSQMIQSPEYYAALAELGRLRAEVRKMAREDRRAQRFMRQADKLSFEGIHPDTAQALALLGDSNLEWSSDLQDCKEELADLLRHASFYPTLKPLVQQLSAKLVYGED
jgi:hypothetical protein